ncbi:hypothetical protein SAM23877_7655 [Streptomyces ambofaciens ATCC 23877]|uniref:Carboxylesterase type B domain-containing protein n=1 Tax=Streptomyces ambofaciens (strain ATCC 23877 / 3486 / DSM 40053 / JCM 4204 / NBRC 12836 / NRRL B-2516) TaxID=278992 RepID=A0A0K2AJ90_STRA7|nr:hypothetical protein SAM23877_0014 [Streptomyces ambofaciens ATCC 23877]AKZ60696.1 hypothetical protein SAM23877_7655 [Streptomyces ambofaciens ATCC 23877]
MAAFLRTPYVAPPFGPRRFVRSEPPQPWAGMHTALTPGPAAPQLGYHPAMAALLEEAASTGEARTRYGPERSSPSIVQVQPERTRHRLSSRVAQHPRKPVPHQATFALP